MDNWRTPPKIFEKLNAEFRFDLDAAADETNALVSRYLTDALTIPEWPGDRIFLNPPYGRMLDPFVRKSQEQATLGKTVVALIPMRTRAAWWHEAVIGRAMEVRCIRKRPKFLRPNRSIPKYTLSCDSAIIIWKGVGLPMGTILTSFDYGG